MAKLKQANKDCWGLFNVNGKGIDPDKLLNALSAGNTDYGSIKYGSISDPKIGATTTPQINAPGASLASGVFVTLNSSLTGLWFADPARDRAATILHELAHAYDLIWGLGSSGLLDENAATTEAGKIEISMENQQTILEDCFK